MATKSPGEAIIQNVGLFLADGLNKDQFYSTIVKTVARNNIPLQRYLTMIVETKDVDGKYKVSDWRNFPLDWWSIDLIIYNMSRITEELLRKRAEHNECMLTTLE